MTARLASSYKLAIMATAFLSAALISNKDAKAAAGSPQSCLPSSTCQVGEFLFDDEYNPVTTGATCTITSRNPDGTIFINGSSMTQSAEGDGFYYYDVSTPATEGYYRTQVCCTVDGEDLCIDKSYEVKDSATATVDESAIATAVWSHSSRTLSSFGSLVTDIWNSSTRTLSSFGSLVSNIWNHSDRNLTTNQLDNGEEIATKGDVAYVGNKVSEVNTNITNNSNLDADLSELEELARANNLMLDELINKPIIETSLEEGMDISEKLDKTNSIANQLYVNTQYLLNKSNDSKINSTEFTKIAGEVGSGDTNTLLGGIDWLSNHWDWREIESAKDSIQSIKTYISRNEVARGGRVSGQNKALLLVLENLEEQVGVAGDNVNETTIYARIEETENTLALFNDSESEIEKMLANWNETSKSRESLNKVRGLEKKIIAVNKIPGASKVLSANRGKDSDAKLKNNLLAVRGLINLNKILMAKSRDASIEGTWLEIGSIVFKTVITNPSNKVTQTVPLNYYLPEEVREEHIIESDEGVEVKYDSEEDKYYVSGEFELKPGETKTVLISVDESLFEITPETIESIKSQAEELSKPLEGTAYFAQGATLKSDINASMSRVETLMTDGVTPEAKIRAYREAEIEMHAAREKLDNLKSLATEAGSAGTMFGFVGGAQVMAVWGLIIILIAGFVFLALYMKQMGLGNTKPVKKGKKAKTESQAKATKSKGRPVIKIAAFMIVFATIVAVLSGFLVNRYMNKEDKSEEVLSAETTVEVEEVDDTNSKEEAIGGPDLVMVSASAEVYGEGSADAEVIVKLTQESEALRIEESEEMVKVAFSNNPLASQTKDKLEDGKTSFLIGWVTKDEVVNPGEMSEVEDSSYINASEAVVLDTPTGWLRVRAAAWGSELGKVDTGEVVKVLSEEDGWLEIEFEEGSGWVSADYIEWEMENIDVDLDL